MIRQWTPAEDARLREIIAKGQSSIHAEAYVRRSRRACIARAEHLGLNFQRQSQRIVWRRYG